MYRLALPAIASLLIAAPTLAEQADETATYLLRYRLAAGERLDYEVTHVAKTKTRIQGSEETSRVHTKSQRHWKIRSVTENEGMVFDHVLDSVAMTQQSGEGEEIRWDSTSGEAPPAAFKVVGDQIGSRLATLTISPRGEEVGRKNDTGTSANLGMGSLAIQFPEEAIPAGHSWSVPQETKVRAEAGEVNVIKIRQLYTLEKVQTGVATIHIRSEPLTPIREESVRAQVVQQLSNGTIRFDVDNGRMLSKQLDWDERVVGFQGPNSLMEYNARFTERLLDGDNRVATRPEL